MQYMTLNDILPRSYHHASDQTICLTLPMACVFNARHLKFAYSFSPVTGVNYLSVFFSIREGPLEYRQTWFTYSIQAVWLYSIPGSFPYNNGPLMLRGTIAMPLGSIKSNVLALDSESFVTGRSSWPSANIVVYLVGSSRLKGSGSVQGPRLSVVLVDLVTVCLRASGLTAAYT